MAKILILTRGTEVSPGKRREVAVRFEPYLTVGTTITIDTVFNLLFSINEHGQTITSPKASYSLDEFDLVVFRGVYALKWRPYVTPVVSYLLYRDIPYLDSKIKPAPVNKYAAIALRQSHGIAPIASVFAAHDELERIIREGSVPFAYPYIVKDANGHKGKLNFLVKTPEEALDVLRENPTVEFIFQEFIPNSGDYRFVVLGDHAVHAKYRVAAAGSHLNNTSQGGTSQEVPLAEVDPELLALAVKAAHLEHLETAGVDIVVHQTTGRPYVLEVNSSPQFPKEAYELYVRFLESQISK